MKIPREGLKPVRRLRLPRDFRSWSPLLLLGMANVAIPFFLISWGEQSIDSAVAAILDAAAPLFTIGIAHLALRDDRITRPGCWAWRWASPGWWCG